MSYIIGSHTKNLAYAIENCIKISKIIDFDY